MATDMTLMHLMCARICHDLAAPASAVAMGLEMLLGDTQDPTTHDLIAYSAQSTISKLEVFRCLTGFSSVPNKPTGVDLEKALKGYWPDNKITISWKIENLEALRGPSARLILAILLTAADGLPRGGVLTVHPTVHPGLMVIAQGPTAVLREDVAHAVTGQTSVSQQTAATIVGFFAHALAEGLGSAIHLQTVDNSQFQIDFVPNEK